ncbi:putative myb DNA-binding like [Lyophyllum shimeji]|uniref:Myb DNA-binding like n=1 Tax=Lyophyllum shimeji TaxID=47721 RepID=A0A9P3PHA8_LYOSH|nr:putative myb DNA-binding like [Lyophyllum shimeji]
MTSRVQKGGAVFRPVVKSRARPEARQPSVAVDTSSSIQHADAPSLSSASMPPPAITPPTGPPTSPMQSMSPALPPSPEPIPPNLSTSVEFPACPPTPLTLPPTVVTAGFTRGSTSTATPTTRPRPGPIIPGPAPPSIASSSTAPIISPNIQDLSNAGSAPHVSSSTSHVLQYSGAENVPTPALNAPPMIKSSRFTVAKNAAAAVSDLSQEPGVDSSLQQADVEVVKPTKRSRSSRAETTSRKPSAKGKKKSVPTSDADQSNDETLELAGIKRKRRASSGTPRPRRSRGPSLPPYDANADPGEEIDPTVVTMASLCSDTGQGRVSRKAAEILSNHAAWKIQNREKRARMRTLMELKKYGREAEAEELESNPAAVEKTLGEASTAGPSNAAAPIPAAVDDNDNGFDYTQNLTTSRFNVQVRIGPNGETIIDEESLVVDRAEAEDTSNYTHVVESDHTKFVNSGSYGKRYRGSRWSAEETELFYNALAQYGENYELIAYVLPGRDRKSCKNKFKAEDKKNPARINHCLNNKIPVDVAALSRMTGKDFSGPVPEVRVSTPKPVEPTVERVEASTAGKNGPMADPGRKKNVKKPAPDDGAIIVGEADNFVPFPDSP